MAGMDPWMMGLLSIFGAQNPQTAGQLFDQAGVPPPQAMGLGGPQAPLGPTGQMPQQQPVGDLPPLGLLPPTPPPTPRDMIAANLANPGNPQFPFLSQPPPAAPPPPPAAIGSDAAATGIGNLITGHPPVGPFETTTMPAPTGVGGPDPSTLPPPPDQWDAVRAAAQANPTGANPGQAADAQDAQAKKMLALAALQGVQRPQAPQPVTHVGVPGGVKAPDVQKINAQTSPVAQALIAALLSHRPGTAMMPPSLGSMIRGR